jgi:hypothetical protein
VPTPAFFTVAALADELAFPLTELVAACDGPVGDEQPRTA